MNNRIKLYPNCKILEWKNFSVDDLEDYLLTLSNVLSFSQTQYIKHALELSIKINLDEDELDYNILKSHNYNYLMAQNEDNPTLTGKKVYYFIVDKKWISANCIEFKLKMDTINTFKDLSISPKTMILRQHKNRWKHGSSPEVYMPLIDIYSEGFTPVLFKKKETTLYNTYSDEELEFGSFYLIFRSQNADQSVNSPVDMFLTGEKELSVKQTANTGWSGYIDPRNNLRRETYGVIYGSDGDGTGTNTGGSITIYGTHEGDVSLQIASNTGIIILRDVVVYGTISGNGFTQIKSYTPKGRANFRKIYFSNIYRFRIDDSKTIIHNPVNQFYGALTITYVLSLGYASNIHGETQTKIYYLGSIYDIDRTDPKLLKIINLPYCPIDLDISNGEITLPPNFVISDEESNFPSLIKYEGDRIVECLSSLLRLRANSNESNPYDDPFELFKIRTLNSYGYREAKNISFETKLLHSDFLLQKFVYDSFAFEFKGEYMPEVDGPLEFDVDMFTSVNMTSNFMFSFRYMEFTTETGGLGVKIDTQDYSNILCIRRNNEIPIYTSAYLNYIRVGYNYDVKTKNRQLTSSIVQGVATTIGSIMSAIAGGPIGIASAIGLGTATLTRFASTIANTYQAEQNIAEKMKQAEMQGVSVSGADEIDIVSQYTNGNKAKLIEYKCSEKMEKSLFDLFYYCGYIANIQGIPNTTSRKVFNFVQAEVLFNITPNLSKEIVDDIVAKYKEGITFLHHYTLQVDSSTTTRGWDFEQQYENWETTIE